MINGFWGRKVGMTQVFSEDNRVVPVTVIDTGNWLVTGIKTEARDGYNALQVGCIKDKYADQGFEQGWIRNPSTYFSKLAEVRCDAPGDYKIGQSVDVTTIVNTGDEVDAVGTTIGRGFAGAMKRHNFSGGPASHGSKLKRATGSVSFFSTQGKIIKGKRMPGHMGNDRCTVRGLKVIKCEDSQSVMIKGSVPGKIGSFIFIRKSR